LHMADLPSLQVVSAMLRRRMTRLAHG